MPKMMNSTRWRVAIAIGLYIGLVVIAGLAFSWLRQGVPEGSPVRYAYALCGPALSLFTHMSYFLFALQSALLIPWLLLGAARAKLQLIAVAGFVISWLGIGWYMHDLF